MNHDYAALLQPQRLWTRPKLLTHPCPIPKAPGVYAWYFKTVPAGVPLVNCYVYDSLPLLYVGIAPKKPSQTGKSLSMHTLYDRIHDHLTGNAYLATCPFVRAFWVRCRHTTEEGYRT